MLEAFIRDLLIVIGAGTVLILALFCIAVVITGTYKRK